MSRSPLLMGVGGALLGSAVLLTVLAVVYQPLLLFVALPFGAAGYLIWYQGTGRLEAKIRASARREARAEFDGGRPGGGDGEFRDRGERATGRRARRERARRERVRQGATDGRRGPRGRGRAYGPGGYGPGATAETGPTTEEAYRRLGLEPGSDPDRIREAYREKVKEVHPDTEDGDEEAFKRVNEAFETLEERVG